MLIRLYRFFSYPSSYLPSKLFFPNTFLTHFGSIFFGFFDVKSSPCTPSPQRIDESYRPADCIEGAAFQLFLPFFNLRFEAFFVRTFLRLHRGAFPLDSTLLLSSALWTFTPAPAFVSKPGPRFIFVAERGSRETRPQTKPRVFLTGSPRPPRAHLAPRVGRR